MQIVVRLLKTSDIFADIIAQLNLVCSSCGTQVPLNAGQKWDFQENRKSCALNAHGWIEQKRWMQVLIEIWQIPVFCCLDSPAVLGIWHRLCAVCYLSPSAGKKTNWSYLGMDFHHISYELATLCCLLRFLISLSLIFWLSISTHKTSNKIPC